MIQRFYGIITICLLFTSLGLKAADKSQQFKSIDDLIAKSKLTDALAMVDKGLSSAPNDIEFLMRKSRIITLQGDNFKEEDDKVKSYETAQKIADKIVETNPKSAKGYLRRAIAKGKLILFKGILQSRSLVLEVREDTKKVLELSETSNYEKGLANYVLGRAHLKLAKKPRALRLPLGLGWASKKKGGEFLKSAAQLYPESVTFNLGYATFLKDNGDSAQAKVLLEKIATLQIYDPNDVAHKVTAKKLLSELN